MTDNANEDFQRGTGGKSSQNHPNPSEAASDDGPFPDQNEVEDPAHTASHPGRAYFLTNHFRRFASGTALLVGVLVFVGWEFDIPLLKSLVPGLATMKPMTALCFMLTGSSLLLLKTNSSARRRLGQVCALFVTLTALLTFSEYAFGWNAIDRLLFAEKVAAEAVQFPGRMAPNTAFSFLLLGVSLIFADKKTKRGTYPSLWLALPSALISLLSIAGYAYDVQSLYYIPQFATVALHTVVVLFLLSLAILFVQGERGPGSIVLTDGPGGTLARWLLPAALVVPFVLGWLRLYGEELGFYGTTFGIALFASSNIVAFTFLIWRVALALNNADAKRKLGEQKFRAITETASDAIITIDDSSTILFANAAAEQIFGYTADEMLGHSLTMLMPEQYRRPHAAGIDRFTSTGERNLSWKAIRLPGLHKNGEEVPLELSFAEYSQDGHRYITSIIRDITERKAAEQKLFETQKQFKELTESLPQLIWTCRGDDGSCDYLSPQWLNYTGISAEEQLGFGWLNQIHPDDRVRTIGRWNKAVESALVFDVEFRIRRFDGVYRWFKTRAVPSKDDLGNIVKWIGTNTDIEDSKKAEEQIHKFNETLEHRIVERTIELQAANKELEAFSYSVSHDLRAPLRHINGFSQALLDDYAGKLDDVGRDYLDQVCEASREMAQMIDDVLQLARVSRSDMTNETVDLSEIAERIVRELRKIDPDRDVNVQIDGGLEVIGDKRLLHFVLRNLIGNAWKFTSEKSNAEITFGKETASKERVFFVKDNGAGFDMQYVDKLFGAFQRLHSAKEFEGTGIGLATVKRVVERHGGRAWADGKVGEGATFYFTLPNREEKRYEEQDNSAG